MGKFETAYNKTLAHEGGYVDDPTDKGGETYKGIARKFHGDWNGWIIIDAETKKAKPFRGKVFKNEFLDGLVMGFYKKKFWDVNRLDDIDAQEVAEETFDTGVNQGVKTAAKYLQKSINLCNYPKPDIVVDGRIGTKTVSAFRASQYKLHILKTMNILQGAKYVAIVDRNKTQKKFFRGWLKRVEL